MDVAGIINKYLTTGLGITPETKYIYVYRT